MSQRTHWETLYKTRSPVEVSWYQEHHHQSLRLIESTGVGTSSQIIDVGGGASTLVDDLLDRGYKNITVLDVSGTGLHIAQRRLGVRATTVTWLEADITQAHLPAAHYDLWHDRAVFHFLTEDSDRRLYMHTLRHSLKHSGYVILSSFSLDGPPRCSGLQVVRYDADGMLRELGDGFRLVETVQETHITPGGKEQRFIYCCFQRGAVT